MKLSGPEALGTLLTKEKLLEVRSKRNQKEAVVENDPINREEAAIKIIKILESF